MFIGAGAKEFKNNPNVDCQLCEDTGFITDIEERTWICHCPKGEEHKDFIISDIKELKEKAEGV